jgi:ribosome-binding factor A
METTRQNKVARLIQKEISEIFLLENKSLFANAMVTVMQVKVASDLSVARIYVSVFAATGINKKDVIKNINLHTKEFRRSLGNRVKNQLRVIPELEFFLDDSLDYIENIENLLKK